MELPDLKDLDLTFKSEADPKVLAFQEKLGKALNTIYKAINKPLNLPRIFNVTGKVAVSSVDKMPPITIDNFSQLANYFKTLEIRIGQLATAISTARGAKIEIPKIEFPKIEIPKNTDLKESLSRVEKALKEIANKETEFPHKISVDNFPPQMTPTPVTNININPLRGLVHTTTTTVSANLTQLPSYGVLNNRRSIIFYNNGSNTVYIGGSNVTTSNGLPILASTFSPAFDSGPTQVWYGVTSSGSSDVRCVELQNDSGN